MGFLPEHIKKKLASTYADRISKRQSRNDKAGLIVSPVRSANIYLRDEVRKIQKIWEKYPFHKLDNANKVIRYAKSDALKALAKEVARQCMIEVQQSGEIFEAFKGCKRVTNGWDVQAPYSREASFKVEAAAECGVLRMTCDKWWTKKLSRLRDRCIEHINIAAGLVKGSASYISESSYREWQTQQKTSLEWLERTVIENDEGFTLPLIEAAMLVPLFTDFSKRSFLCSSVRTGLGVSSINF